MELSSGALLRKDFSSSSVGSARKEESGEEDGGATPMLVEQDQTSCEYSFFFQHLRSSTT